MAGGLPRYRGIEEAVARAGKTRKAAKEAAEASSRISRKHWVKLRGEQGG